MKTFGLVLALLTLSVGASMAATATIDFYGEWNMVSAPLVPFVSTPWNGLSGSAKGVFDPVDIDFGGSLSRWDASTQGMVGWSMFVPDAFGNILLGDGYWLYQPGSGSVTYDGVPDGVPDGVGNMTDMWVSLPGGQTDGVDAGGWHIIGTPFNHPICFSKEQMNLLGDNICVTDGSTLKTWGEAVAALWVDDPMVTWDGVTQGNATAGYFFANDEFLRPGKGYWVHTNKDNLALIIPSTSPAP